MTIEDDFDDRLARVRRGDQDAAAAVFREVQPSLLRYLRSQEPAAADDLSADVWLAVTAGLDDFVGDGAAFRAWVFTVARRRLLDHRRRTARRRTTTVDPSDLRAPPVADDTGAPTDAQHAVDLITTLLPPHQAEVVLLRVVADLDVATVARLTGRSPTWVRVNQHRGLRRLADRLGSGRSAWNGTDVTA